ncbi:ribosomal biogenesis factor isoform 2-T2 [Amazona ochrocephala]
MDQSQQVIIQHLRLRNCLQPELCDLLRVQPAGASGRINIKNAEKVNTINKAFAEVQKEIQQISKGIAAEPEKSHQVSTNMEEEPVDVDAATGLLSQL